MALKKYFKNNIWNIIFDGDIETSDLKDLKYSLDNLDYCEITFLTQSKLSYKVINILENSKSEIVYYIIKRPLWLYLQNLNFKNLRYITTPVSKRIYIKSIAIGGSAGSIEKLIQLLPLLQLDNVSVFIILHQDSTKDSILSTILQRYTKYEINNASNNMKVEIAKIYIAPPDYHMLVVGGYIFLTKTKKIKYVRPSIDISFESLSKEYGSSLATILLCGYGNDGSGAFDVLNNNRSTIVVEDPNECEADNMPLAMIEKNRDNKVGTIKEIVQYLELIINHNIEISLDSIKDFMLEINKKYKYNFIDYNLGSLLRRLNLSMDRVGVDSFNEYKDLVLSKKVYFEDLLDSFSITYTEFFRDPQVFKKLREDVFIHLDSYPFINIWCAGSSSGQEAYSYAILLDELGLLHKSRIYATDFNDNILQEAKNGMYAIDDFEEYKTNYENSGGKNRFENYFIFKKGYFEVIPRLKEKILFFNHNLVTDGIINSFEIVSCRNVLIYFEHKLQKKILSLFEDSLVRNGFLILGEYEITNEQKSLKSYIKSAKIYEKKE